AVQALLLCEPGQALPRGLLEARALRARLEDREHRQRRRAHVVLVGPAARAAVALAKLAVGTRAPEALGMLVVLEPLERGVLRVLERAALVGDVGMVVHEGLRRGTDVRPAAFQPQAGEDQRRRDRGAAQERLPDQPTHPASLAVFLVRRPRD